jgi:hypothetical protein
MRVVAGMGGRGFACFPKWLAALAESQRSMLMAAVKGPEAELAEFLAHLEAGDAKPAGGFGLVALGEADGLGVQLGLEVGNHFREGILFFAALDPVQKVGDVGGVRLASDGRRLPRTGEHLLDVFESNGERARCQKGLTDDIFQLADVAGPRLFLQPVQGVGLNSGGIHTQVGRIALHEEPDKLGNVFAPVA